MSQVDIQGGNVCKLTFVFTRTGITTNPYVLLFKTNDRDILYLYIKLMTYPLNYSVFLPLNVVIRLYNNEIHPLVFNPMYSTCSKISVK